MKEYLGDGVYADFDGYHLVLTTENGIATTNTIYLEPEVTFALRRYITALYDGCQVKEDKNART